MRTTHEARLAFSRSAGRFVSCCFALAALATTVTANASRHPRPRRPMTNPAGVPETYVLTRNGFFHPSCVITLEPDETLGQDLVVRGPGGAPRDRIPPCPHMRYSASGQPTHQPHLTNDGWIVWYDYTDEISRTSTLTLSTDWVVPP